MVRDLHSLFCVSRLTSVAIVSDQLITWPRRRARKLAVVPIHGECCSCSHD